MERDRLIKIMTKQVTYKDQEPYPELKIALEALVDRLKDEEPPSPETDWPAIVAEAVNLRPRHGS